MDKNAVGLVALAIMLMGVLIGVSLMVMHGFLPDRVAPVGPTPAIVADPFGTPAARDEADLEVFATITTALEKFRARNNSYPDELKDLVTSGIMNVIPRERSGSGEPREYRYEPWAEKERPGLCSALGSPKCLGYHLGVSLEDPRNLILFVDADAGDMSRGRNFSGSDRFGCFHEEGLSCFDVTAEHPYHVAEDALTTETARNATYQIGETFFPLVDGVAARPAAPDSATIERVKVVFGPVAGDLDGDRMPDAALALAYEPGGSGTFIFLAAAVAVSDGTMAGSRTIALGDRVLVRSLVIERGVITVELLTRKEGESFAAPPTVPGIRRFILVGGSLVEQVAK